VVHQDPARAALVEVGARLLEERVDRELEVKRLDFDLVKAVSQGRGLARGLEPG